jgi:hypothetical protein
VLCFIGGVLLLLAAAVTDVILNVVL